MLKTFDQCKNSLISNNLIENDKLLVGRSNNLGLNLAELKNSKNYLN